MVVSVRYPLHSTPYNLQPTAYSQHPTACSLQLLPHSLEPIVQVDTPGFGDGVDNTACWTPVVQYIDDRWGFII